MPTDPKDKKKKQQKKLTKLVKKRTKLKEKELKGPFKKVRTKIKTKRLKKIQKKINKNPIAIKNKRDGDAKKKLKKDLERMRITNPDGTRTDKVTRKKKDTDVVRKKTKKQKLKDFLKKHDEKYDKWRPPFRKSVPLDKTPPPKMDSTIRRLKKEAKPYRMRKT
jgi:hypothetical protein